MTTRAREVEALRELEAWLQKQIDAADMIPLAVECWLEALSALIAECEAAKAELAEAVKVMNALADKVKECDAASGSIFAVAAIHGCKYRGPTWIAELSDASAFIAKHTPPQPVPVGGETP